MPPGQTVARFPEKTELIMLTDRPPQLETPLHYFREDLTPNEAFFVRWHYEGIPTYVDLRTFRLNVGGHVNKPLTFTVDDFKTSVRCNQRCRGQSVFGKFAQSFPTASARRAVEKWSDGQRSMDWSSPQRFAATGWC